MLFKLALLCSVWLIINTGCQQIAVQPQGNTHIAYDVNRHIPTKSVQSRKNPEPILSSWYFESFELCHANNAFSDDNAFAESKVFTNAKTAQKISKPTDIWPKLRSGFAFEYGDERHYRKALKRLKKYGHLNTQLLHRAEPYLYYIVKALNAENLPQEIALLPLVESGFDPFAYSHGQASGLWQFIPSTGKMLGLKQNWWYDGRRDIKASTQAAITYLKRLNRQFEGDWLLTLAAYNAGAGNVRKAIKRNRKKSLPIDFWHLKLPKETQAYVPKLLAWRELILNANYHQFHLPDIKDTPHFESVAIESQIDLAQAASLADIEIETLYKLNPAFNRWASAPDGPHYLLLPKANAIDFSRKLAELPKTERISWQRYTVRSGDSLSVIAQKLGTKATVIRNINQLSSDRIKIGQKLMVPKAYQNADFYSQSAVQRLIKRQSKGKGNKQVYIVKSGDSFWTIARAHKISVKQLAHWNNMAPRDTLRPGKELVIWQKPKRTQAAKPSQPIVRKLHYTVKNGDSLARIANRFNVSLNDLIAWNNVNPKSYLKPGQSLKLFVDVRNSGRS